MLRKLSIFNFRGFDSHELSFAATNVMVGKNNAGKSTIVEALRLISIISERCKNLSYIAPPPWTGIPKRQIGVAPSLQNLEINFDSIFFQYREPPARITAEFTTGASISIYLERQDRVFAVLKDADERIVTTRSAAAAANIPGVAIMPQVTPVQRTESVLNRDYVRRSVSSHLASSHFRNQLLVFSPLFERYQAAVEETWPGVRVTALDIEGQAPEQTIHLQIRNDDFVAEVGAMGHGLQMWLQTIWFLTREHAAQTVILDEPDVYMHADLQRKIVRFLRNRFQQVLVTTHSVEIMSEVQPEEIVVIDRRVPKSAPATSIPAVQGLIDSIGSTHNLQFARLWRARKFIFVEGNDLSILKQVQNRLYPQSALPIDVIPNTQIGGWGGWGYVVGSAKTLKNAVGENVVPYCVLDSDYKTTTAIEERRAEAKRAGIELHVWKRKEIESYLLIASCIQRIVVKRAAKRTIPTSEAEFDAKMREIAESLREEMFDATSTELINENRAGGLTSANKRAREQLRDREEEIGLLGMAPAKKVLARLSEWMQEEYGVPISAMAIAYEMTEDEMPQEIKDVVRAIETSGEL